eukprot:jgi/Chlat1/5128/Chrsp33S08967
MSAVSAPSCGAPRAVFTEQRSSSSFLRGQAVRGAFYRGAALRVAPAGRWQQRRLRVARVSAVAEGVRTASPAPLGEGREFSAAQKLLGELPLAARAAAAAVVVLGTAVVGGQVASTIVPATLRTTARYVGAAVAGAVGFLAVKKLHEDREGGAAIELHNTMLAQGSLTAEDVNRIAQKYGVTAKTPSYNLELRALYDGYLSNMIPRGDEPLVGDEAERLRVFKDALGLEDRDAADVHMEVGRRIYRQRLEVGSKDLETEERRAFQKLVFVSTQLFGEAKARFLLPWKRVFNVTDGQLSVALRDNASRLYRKHLEAVMSDNDLVVSTLQEARQYQLTLGLGDDVASEHFQDLSRKAAEGFVEQALEVANARTRKKDLSPAIGQMFQLLSYNKQRNEILKAHPRESLPAGFGVATLMGGDFDTDRRREDLKALYRIYLTDALEFGALTAQKETELQQLKNIFGLGNKEAEAVTLETTARVYRKFLRDAAQPEGTLDTASSPAEFLEELCDKLRFAPESAAKVHEDIYRQKLEASVASKRLSEEDNTALQRLRVILCIPRKTVQTANRDIVGKLFREVVDDALKAPAGSFSSADAEQVIVSQRNLRLDTDTAKEILGVAVRAQFMNYIKESKQQKSRLDSAKKLKEMIFFSNMVVVPLLEGLKEKPMEAETDAKDQVIDVEPEKEEATAESQAEAPSEEVKDEDKVRSLKKTQDAMMAELAKSQREVTLRDELDKRDREDLYKNFLIYCLSGNVVQLAFGATVQVERDQMEFVRLSQLGDILGLNPVEIQQIHSGLAEQAFEANVKQILADGRMNSEKAGYMKSMQDQLGLSDEAANKIVSKLVNTRISKDMEASMAEGKLSIDDIKELRDQGANVDGMIPINKRLQLYKKSVELALSAGSVDFDAERILEREPAILGLAEDRTSKVIKEIGREKKKNALIQAVAALRKKNKPDVVSQLNNLVNCQRLLPEVDVDWSVKEEKEDLYSLYASDVSDAEKKQLLQTALKIDSAAAQQLVESAHSFEMDVEEEEAFF